MLNMTEGSISKAIIAFSIPMLLGNVFQQLYTLLDAIIVGRVAGTEALAAVGVSFPIMFLMISLVLGLGTGSGIVLSQYFGAKDFARLRRQMHTAYVFFFAASLLTTVVGIAAAEPLLKLMGTPAAILDQARTFLTITFGGMVFIFGYNAISSVLRSVGDSVRPLWFLIFANGLNIVLVLLFVGVFHWGVAGSAWATVIAQGVAFVVSLVYIQTAKNDLLKIRWKELVIDRHELAVMLKLGLPSALQQGMVALAFVVLNSIVTPYGATVMAGYAAASRMDSFAMLPIMTLSMAISTFVGQNIGAGRLERVHKGYLAALAIGTGISLFVTALCLLIPHVLIGLFDTNPEVIRIGSQYLVVVSSFYAVFNLMFTTGGVLRGAGAMMFQMVSILIALWAARVPASLYLSQAMHDPQGIWWGIPAGWIIGALLLVWYYLSGRWKTKAVVRKAPQPMTESEPVAEPAPFET